jgi:hypothetical protein
MMRFLHWFVIATIAISCGNAWETQPSVREEVVMVSPAVPGDLVVVDRGDHLEVLEPKYLDGAVQVDQTAYPLDEALSSKLYESYKAGSRLTVSEGGQLCFDGRVINLPKKAKVRQIWKAIVWRRWVIVLARTSESDAIANLEPPFLCNELVAFRVDGTKPMIRWLASFPGKRLSILRPPVKK